VFCNVQNAIGKTHELCSVARSRTRLSFRIPRVARGLRQAPIHTTEEIDPYFRPHGTPGRGRDLHLDDDPQPLARHHSNDSAARFDKLGTDGLRDEPAGRRAHSRDRRRALAEFCPAWERSESRRRPDGRRALVTNAVRALKAQSAVTFMREPAYCACTDSCLSRVVPRRAR
jgi:hypothetical protein